MPDIFTAYQREYGCETAWRQIAYNMADMADKMGLATVRDACEIAAKMPDRALAIAVIDAANGDQGRVMRALGLI